MRRSCLLTIAAAATLCACGRQSGVPTTTTASAADARTPLSISSPEFVGRWAAAPSACADQAWEIRANQLRSPGPLSCSLDRIRPTPAGYIANGLCQVGKAAAPGRLMFTMVRQDGSVGLTLDGGPFIEPVPLVRCAGSGQVQAQVPTPPDEGQG